MIVLKNQSGDFIYLDVVTQYSRNFSSQVSQHPVDGSGTVSDHVITQNPKYQIVGNITGADFNSGKPDLTSEDRSFMGISQIVVESDIASVIEVSYEKNPLTLLPDIAGQFFLDTLPEIKNLSEGRDAIYSEQLLFEVLKKFQTRKEKLVLYDFDNDILSGEPVGDIFITNLAVNESATTGDALAFDITLEKVTISNLLEEEIPEDVQQDFRQKNAEKEQKGQQSTQVVDDSVGEVIETGLGSALSFFLGL